MNRFENVNNKKRIMNSVPYSIILFIAIIVVFVLGITYMSDTYYKDDKESLKKAIERDVAHTYALKGAYPMSLEELERDYGLRYDKSKYIVNYECVADNMYPVITIIGREDK